MTSPKVRLYTRIEAEKNQFIAFLCPSHPVTCWDITISIELFNELAQFWQKGCLFETESKKYVMSAFRECLDLVETWAVKVKDLARTRLGMAERMMVRRVYGVSLKDWKRISINYWVLSRSGIEGVENKIQGAMLRWFEHVERKEENDWRKKCPWMIVTGVMGWGAPKKTWRSCVKRDITAMSIKEEMAQDRYTWRKITGGLESRKVTAHDDDDDHV